MTSRAPDALAASTTESSNRYISQLVVTPASSISADPRVIPHHASSGVIRPSRGHMASVNQRCRGRPSPDPRTSVIGVWQWAFTRPGMSNPPTLFTTASVTSGASPGGPTQTIRPSTVSTTPGAYTESSVSQVTTMSAVKRT